MLLVPSPPRRGKGVSCRASWRRKRRTAAWAGGVVFQAPLGSLGVKVPGVGGGMFSRYRKGPLGFHLKKTNDGAAKSLDWPGLRVSVEGVRPKTNLRGLRHEPNPYEIATSDCMHGRQM